ncbi:MAG: TetR/AcrR family transcriptional regulator [Kiritimatiellia bacterium]
MARKVDHEQRKREIAEKAIRLFSQVGYDNVSLIMIAAASGVSRTVLYRYFCSKREVMDAAIVTASDVIARRCTKIMTARGKSMEKLEGVCHAVADVMFEHKEFLVAVFDFVVGMVRSGANMDSNIMRFTAGTRTAIRRLVGHALERGEIPPTLAADRIADTIYAQFESCAMRIVIGTEQDSRAARGRFSDIIRALTSRK